MPDVKIRANRNGSLRVEGGATLLNSEDEEIPTPKDKPFYLCRCGASENKPFCDGSHKRIQFSSE